MKMIMDAQFASAVAANAENIALLAQVAADSFSAMTRYAGDEADNIKAVFGGLGDVLDPLRDGAASVFAGIRQDANWTRDSIANILGAYDAVRNAGVGLDRGANWVANLNPLRAQQAGPAWSNKKGEFLAGDAKRRQEASNRREAAGVDRMTHRLFGADGFTFGSRARLPTQGTGEGAAAAKKAEADRKRAAAAAKRLAEQAARTAERFERDLAGERRDQLRAQADLAVGADARFDFEQMMLDEDKAARLAEIARDTDLSAEQKKQLSAEVEKTAAVRSQVNRARANEELAKEAFAVAQARSTNEQDILQAQLGLVRSSRERRDLELKLLELQFRQLRAAEDAVLASATSTDAEKQIARERKAVLDRLEGYGRNQVGRQNAGPLQSYFDSLPRNADELNDAYESVAADGLKQLNDGLADAITGTRSLGDVFTDIAGSIIADLARIAIQQAIIKPLQDRLLGASSGGSTGGLFSQILRGVGLVSGRASASGASTGSASASFDSASFASKYGIPGLAAGGTIGGRPGIDRNVLSINGVPRAMVSANERIHVSPNGSRSGAAQPVVIAVEEGSLFRPVVRSEAAGVSVRAVTKAAKVQANRGRQLLQ